jgi:hypothetical protein
MNIYGDSFGKNTIVETATGKKDGYCQLYTWECKSLNFKFEAWISYLGDYSLAVSKMRRQLNKAYEESKARQL